MTGSDDDVSHQGEDDEDARIEELKARATALNGGQMKTWTSPDCPSAVLERFWKHVLAFDSAIEEQPFEALIRSGLTLPPPEELDNQHITAKLWEVIRGMAFLRMFLLFTNHLTDRELYAHLWNDTLRDPCVLEPDDAKSAWFIDLTSGGGKDDVEIYLKYYADEEERRDWAEDWPDDRIPDAASPPFDRDRHLPTAGF